MYLEKCSAEQQKAICEQFNITNESLKQDAKYLMEWMKKQPHLPSITDEELLSNMIIQCKNSIEKTKKKLDTYYSAKALLPEVFSGRDPTSSKIKNVFNTICLIPLPKLTPTGHRIFIFRIFNPENVNSIGMDDYLSANALHYDISLKDDSNNGLILIYDMNNLSMSLANLMFRSARKLMIVAPELYSFRIEKVHIIVKMNDMLSKMTTLVKSLMKKKIQDKMEFWTDKKPDLCKMFPAEIIPQDYGGKEKSMQELLQLYYEYICEFRDWVKSENYVKADLSKRTDNLFKTSFNDNLDGSFRQLVID